jgi:hypothetical protein
MGTMRSQCDRIFWAGALLGIVWLSGCGDSKPPMLATLTFKDGTHFSGTVQRREPKAITMTDSRGEAHTFLYSELANISYPQDVPAAPAQHGNQTQVPDSSTGGGSRAEASSRSPAAAGGGPIQIHEGTELPVRNDGILDACCLIDGAMSLGTIDADVKDASGQVLIPAGANVTIITRHHRMVEGRVTLEFELGSADFYGRHYLVTSAKGALEPGAIVTFAGPKEGTPEAKVRGLWLHLDDQTYMGFKTATPTIFKPSQ